MIEPRQRTATLGRRVRRALAQSARAWKRIPLHLPGPLFEAWLSSVAARREKARARRRRRVRRHHAAQRRAFKARLTAAAKADLAAFLRSDARLTSPSTEGDADVSVVIVVWNQAHLLLRCLRALLAESRPAIELVIVDNASDAETRRLLDRVDGARQLRNDENVGFLLACNQGVAASRGRNVVLLNSDAFVRPSAVGNALAVLEAAADVGAVGGKLILPSGELQEAGSIIWSDGITSGYARGLQPDAPEAADPRTVDYCSGAFLMTPRVLWDRLGGFDVAFAPAYFEEADYCMRLREAGYRVVYEPSVAVDHYELGSEAKAGDALALSERNRQRFCQKHADRLASDHPVRVAVAT